MALNDSKRMSEYDFQQGLGKYNNNTDVFKWVMITEVYSAIDETTANIGIANLTKVASAGLYVQDSTLANSAWTKSGLVSKLDYDDFSYGADGSNPVTGKTWACYNDTSTNKDVYKIVDMTVDDGTTPADTTLGFNGVIFAGGAGTVTTNS
jgi:hypothetical protein